MCGRYVTPDIAEAERNLTVERALWGEYERSYNVAPTDRVPVLRARHGQHEGALMRWGLVPFSCHGIAPRYATINAAIEKLASNPCWRGPWQREQRCLLPALGFYEWQLQPDGRKQPFYIQPADATLFCFAGLWDSSRGSDGSELLSCAVITLPANALMCELHNSGAHPFRMPSILARADAERWLRSSSADARALLQPYPSERMSAYRVSTQVNDPKLDDATLLSPAAASAAGERGARTHPENLSLF